MSQAQLGGAAPSGGVGQALKGVFGLSLGTIGTRGLAAVGQVLLAFWLTPTEFGYWAAANSILAFVSGLANFGEVNGYLSGHGAHFAVARGVTRRLNSVLAVLGLFIAGGYALAGRWEVAVLGAIVAITIPFTGESDLLYSASVRHGRFRKAVVAQFGAAVSKVALGVVIAVTTHSALAIAVSTLAYSLVMDVWMYRIVGREVKGEPSSRGDAIPRRERLSWAVNSWMMTLPLQAGFVVGQFVASPHLVGLYYFSYQITLGISGVLSGPLAKVSLSTLGKTRVEDRTALALDLSSFFGAALLAVCAFGSMVVPPLTPFISSEWAAALPATVILVASLPIRMMTPVMDAYQQSQNRWWQSTAFNLADAIGTSLAALTLLTGSVTVLAIALTAWKIALGIVRTWIVLRHASVWGRIALTVPLALGTAALCAGALTTGWASYAWLALAVVIAALWGVGHLRLRARIVRTAAAAPPEASASAAAAAPGAVITPSDAAPAAPPADGLAATIGTENAR
ncbi:MAG TPA: oligosaccharide flippase family protein [Gryllotalpicola sp.]